MAQKAIRCFVGWRIFHTWWVVSSPTSFTTSVSLLPTVMQNSAEMGHEVVAVTDSWTDVQQQNPWTPSVTQGFAEHILLADWWRELGGQGLCKPPLTPLKTLGRTTTWQVLLAWQQLDAHPNILVRGQMRTMWILLPSWIVLLIVSANAWIQMTDCLLWRKTLQQHKKWSLLYVWHWRISWRQPWWRQPIARGIRSFLSGDQGVVRVPRQEHTWFDGGSSQRSHCQAATGNWTWPGLCDSARGSYESQKHEDHLLFESNKLFRAANRSWKQWMPSLRRRTSNWGSRRQLPLWRRKSLLGGKNNRENLWKSTGDDGSDSFSVDSIVNTCGNNRGVIFVGDHCGQACRGLSTWQSLTKPKSTTKIREVAVIFSSEDLLRLGTWSLPLNNKWSLQ